MGVEPQEKGDDDWLSNMVAISHVWQRKFNSKLMNVSDKCCNMDEPRNIMVTEISHTKVNTV